MFEKLRERWTKAINPMVLRMEKVDPNYLTWTSLFLALGSFFLVAGADLDNRGALAIVVAVAMAIAETVKWLFLR